MGAVGAIDEVGDQVCLVRAIDFAHASVLPWVLDGVVEDDVRGTHGSVTVSVFGVADCWRS